MATLFDDDNVSEGSVLESGRSTWQNNQNCHTEIQLTKKGIENKE